MLVELLSAEQKMTVWDPVHPKTRHYQAHQPGAWSSSSSIATSNGSSVPETPGSLPQVGIHHVKYRCIAAVACLSISSAKPAGRCSCLLPAPIASV